MTGSRSKPKGAVNGNAKGVAGCGTGSDFCRGFTKMIMANVATKAGCHEARYSTKQDLLLVAVGYIVTKVEMGVKQLSKCINFGIDEDISEFISILGGIGSRFGALVGAIVIGEAEEFTAYFYSPAYWVSVGFMIIAVLLLARTGCRVSTLIDHMPGRQAPPCNA